MAPRTDFPPVRACLFDMDGLLLDTEDIYSLCINTVLHRYGRPTMPWSIKAKLQGRPFREANAIFNEWAKLPIPDQQYLDEVAALHQENFPKAAPLPGVIDLMANLGRTRWWDVKKQQDSADGRRVHIALATSSHSANFKLKTDHLTELFSVFESHRRVLGDDKRIPPGRGKPLPDIYLVALKTINDSLPEGESPIAPEECLVFEDSVPGVEAGRRAGMRVVWVPHPMLKQEYEGREKEILAGRMGEAGDDSTSQVGEIDDGWGEYRKDLVDFPYAHYGMVIPPPDVESDPTMQENAPGGGFVAETT